MAMTITPREMPERKTPVLVGAAVVGLALPLFVIVGWNVRGWALGAFLWGASQLLGLLFAKVGIGDPTLRGSGLVAFGMMGRGILVALVCIFVAVDQPHVALAGALVYAAGYSAELATGLSMYFGGEPRG
jgi:hypothetical protein